jgi:hypothetical protein
MTQGKRRSRKQESQQTRTGREARPNDDLVEAAESFLPQIRMF